ncbi:hypothetical protein ACWGCW_35655 [Streptomyces sp. NPDC054933]
MPSQARRDKSALSFETRRAWDGFTLALAQDTTGHPAGFVYGRPSCHLAALADRPPPVENVPLELRELAVAPYACGRGIGATLHDTLIAATPAGPRSSPIPTPPRPSPSTAPAVGRPPDSCLWVPETVSPTLTCQFGVTR